MATLTKLVADGALTEIEVETEGESPWRYLYGIDKFTDWLANDLPKLTSQLIGVEDTPEEQVDDLFAQFVSGAELVPNERYRLLTPKPKGVWELKTPDIRIFGWFPKKDHFIAVFGNDASFIKDRNLYNGYLTQVVRQRDLLNLDEAKFVPGENPNDVLSIRN